MEKIKVFYTKKPLQAILIVALAVRLIAVVFSQGYAFHDDHFLVVDAAASWAGDYDWNAWMPEMQRQIFPDKEPIPDGHSLLYPGIHYLIISGLNGIGITAPTTQMYFIRLLHALLSLLVIVFSFRIVEHYSERKYAITAGWFLALLWIMPFLSVRNLVEIVCVPFLLWGLWKLIQNEHHNKNLWHYALAGLIMGLSFSIRFQTLVIVASAGLVLLFQKKWKPAFAFGAGAIFCILLIQGTIDLFIWKRPFAELTEYILYNIRERYTYGTNNYYMYITLLPGILLIVPLGLSLMVGWAMTAKKWPLLFWPAFLFFIFHTYFPNKQERFILPILPIIITAGVLGWYTFMDKSKFWQRHRRWYNGAMVFFWVVNLVLLPLVSTTYTKRSRCEAMVELGKLPDSKEVLIEETRRNGITQMPTYYAGKDLKFYGLPETTFPNIDTIKTLNRSPRHIEEIQTPLQIAQNNWTEPQYILFVNERDIEVRVDKMKSFYPNLTLVTVIEPSYIDVMMRKLAPANNNQYMFLYKTGL